MDTTRPRTPASPVILCKNILSKDPKQQEYTTEADERRFLDYLYTHVNNERVPSS